MAWIQVVALATPVLLALMAWGARTHYRLSECMHDLRLAMDELEDLKRAHELHAKYLDSIGKRLSVIETNTEWIKQALLRLDGR